MENLKFKIAFLSLLSCLSFMFIGCQEHMHLTPEDTILDSNYKNSVDWVDDEASYKNEGLSLRSASSSKGLSIQAKLLLADKSKAEASVYFSFDHSNITAHERTKLREITEKIIAQKEADLLVVGHCDWRGTHDYNLALGERRASSVETYLINLGIDPRRITTLSKGSLDARVGGPISECAQDRRADILVLR